MNAWTFSASLDAVAVDVVREVGAPTHFIRTLKDKIEVKKEEIISVENQNGTIVSAFEEGVSSCHKLLTFDIKIGNIQHHMAPAEFIPAD